MPSSVSVLQGSSAAAFADILVEESSWYCRRCLPWFWIGGIVGVWDLGFLNWGIAEESRTGRERERVQRDRERLGLVRETKCSLKGVF